MFFIPRFLISLITFPGVIVHEIAHLLHSRVSNFYFGCSKFQSDFYLPLWIGLSIGTHAFPSNQDMNNFVATVAKVHSGGSMLWAAKLFSGLLRLANILRFIWLMCFTPSALPLSRHGHLGIFSFTAGAHP
jgi:hypothetical protein